MWLKDKYDRRLARLSLAALVNPVFAFTLDNRQLVDLKNP